MPTVSITEHLHASAGPASEVAVTHLDGDRIVTAHCNDSGDLRLISWDVATDGTFARRGDATGPVASRIALCDWSGQGGVVTAIRNGTGHLEVAVWQIGTGGGFSKKDSATAGAVRHVAIASPDGFDGVVTAAVKSDGDLEVIAWKVDAAGALTKGTPAVAGAASALAIAGLRKHSGHARVAVGIRNGSQQLEIISWSVDSAGGLMRLGRADAGTITDLALAARANVNADVLSFTTGPSADVTAIGWTVADDGSIARLATATGGAATSLAITTFRPNLHEYAVAAMRGETGALKLIVWRNGLDLTRHGEITSDAITSVVLTSWSRGVVTAAVDSVGALRLTSWHVRPAGVRLLRQEWPLPSAMPPAPPHQIAATDAVRTEHVRASNHPVAPSRLPPTPPSPDGSGGDSPAAQTPWYPSVEGCDPMIAVGHDFVVTTQSLCIAFYDKQHQPLLDADGNALYFSTAEFFRGFTDPLNPDGSVNTSNINLISPTHISDFNDARTAYDPVTKRFVILSSARAPSTNVTRYFVFGISKTQDPRDGFYQYITTESNYRDFPRVVIHNGMILQAHNAAGQAAEGETPVLYGFDLSAASQGLNEVPNWQYYPSDLNGAPMVYLVQHHGDAAGVTSCVDLRSTTVHVVAFPTPANMWFAPTPIFVDAQLTRGAPWPGPFMVFRKSTLHIAGTIEVAPVILNVQAGQNSIRVVRVPFSQFAPAVLVVDTAHIVDVTFGGVASTDGPNDLISYDQPGYAVNVNGDALISYGRTAVKTGASLFPEVRYSVWKHGEAGPRRSGLLQAGEYMPVATQGGMVPINATHGYAIDYSTAVTDPADDTTVWFVHDYAHANAPNAWRTVVGAVNPSS